MPNNITIRDLIPTIKEVVDNGSEATFIPHGVSMQPMLYGGRDEIILVKPKFPLNKYDIPLYLRKNGTVVLHRIVKVTDTENGRRYFMRGDNTWELEEGIEEKDMVAVVSRFCRKGKWYSAQSRSYRLYSVLWCKLFPLRKAADFLCRLPFRAARKLKRMITK